MSQSLSLSEIDALCRKAARGACYSWGMAEEAGRAARWLAACGLPGPELLVAWLQERTLEPAQHQPHFDGQCWRAAASVCPLVAGALLSDSETALAGGQRFELRAVAQPALLLPQVARAALASGTRLHLIYAAHHFVCATQVHSSDAAQHYLSEPSDVLVCCDDSLQAPQMQCFDPAAHARPVAVEALAALQQLAHNTYAPATEASRLAGAGSGLNDND